MFWKSIFIIALVSAAAAKRQNVLKMRPARSYQMDPDTCLLYPDYDFFFHENCDQYYQCDEFNELVEGFCPPEFPVFDAREGFCGENQFDN